MTNGSYTVKAASRLRRIIRRRDYLKTKLDLTELPENIRMAVEAEWSALVWAVQILEEYVELYQIGKGEMYWIREYNKLAEKNHRMFGDTLIDATDPASESPTAPQASQPEEG